MASPQNSRRCPPAATSLKPGCPTGVTDEVEEAASIASTEELDLDPRRIVISP
jgi:hypothetical protein